MLITHDRLVWIVSQFLWYADESKIANPFTAGFWLRLDILCQLIPLNDGGSTLDTLFRGLHLFWRLFLLMAGLLLYGIVSDSAIFAMTKVEGQLREGLLITDSGITLFESITYALTEHGDQPRGRPGWKPTYRSPPPPRLRCLLLIFALHDSATHLLSASIDTPSLLGQFGIYVLLNIVMTPLHAICVQNALCRRDLWFPSPAGLSYIDLLKLLWLPTTIAACARGLAIWIIVTWLRSLPSSLGRRDAAQIVLLSSWDEIASAVAMILTLLALLALCILLIMPALTACTLAQAALLPESIPTYDPLQRILPRDPLGGSLTSVKKKPVVSSITDPILTSSALLPETAPRREPLDNLLSPNYLAGSLTLTTRSWRSLTIRRLVLASSRMLLLAVVVFTFAPDVRIPHKAKT